MGNKIGKTQKKRDKEFDKKSGAVLVFFAICWVIYYKYGPITLGGDYRYDLYISIIPVLSGALVVTLLFWKYFYRNFFRMKEINFKEIGIQFLVILLHIVITTFFSFVSFGLLSQITFDVINQERVKDNQTGYIDQDVKNFNRSKKFYSIDFNMENAYQRVYISRKIYRKYENEDPATYKIRLRGNKGIWNTYILEDWKLIKK